MKKIKIVVAGIGGVGGYFGGKLARCFQHSDEVEVHFIARGEHLKEIKNNGLRVIEQKGEFVVVPRSVTDNAADVGVADYIIVCTKSYDLENMLQQLQPCIGSDTVILPLLNGVDSCERIKALLPHNPVLEGCVYIVSRIAQPGVVENTGNIQKLYFGADDVENSRQELLEQMLTEAGIEATRSPDILQVLWEKYIFISPTATATSFFNSSIGALVADEEQLKTTTALIEEVKQLSKAKRIVIPGDITERTINKLRSFPFDATSSMHRDFREGKHANELESLTGFVVRMSEAHNIATPVYRQMYEQLKTR